MAKRRPRNNKRKRRPGPKRTSGKNRKHTTNRRRGNYAVYVISSGDRLKIGFTRSSVADRLKSLQTGSPYPLSLLAQFRHYNPALLEKFLHSVLDEYRVSGEWFICPVERVRELVDIAEARLDVKSSHGEWSALCVELGGKRLVEPRPLRPSERRSHSSESPARKPRLSKPSEGVIRSGGKTRKEELAEEEKERAELAKQMRKLRKQKEKERRIERQDITTAAGKRAALDRMKREKSRKARRAKKRSSKARRIEKEKMARVNSSQSGRPLEAPPVKRGSA